MEIPNEVWVVITKEGADFVTAWPEACHEHILDGLQREDDYYKGAVVRKYMLETDDIRFQLETLDELNYAVDLLARWCVAVDEGGAGWDYWDDYYKEAMHRPSPIRYQLDMRINYLRSENEQ